MRSMATHYERMSMETVLAIADQDGDASLSLDDVAGTLGQAENKEALSARFIQLDANSDNKLDADELQSAWSSHRAREMDAFDAEKRAFEAKLAQEQEYVDNQGFHGALMRDGGEANAQEFWRNLFTYLKMEGKITPLDPPTPTVDVQA
jgi:Ca2+-binding EF-hand superfamily protein